MQYRYGQRLLLLLMCFLITGCTTTLQKRQKTALTTYPFGQQEIRRAFLHPPALPSTTSPAPSARKQAQAQRPLPIPGAIAPVPPPRYFQFKRAHKTQLPLPLSSIGPDPRVLKLRMRLVSLTQSYLKQKAPLLFQGRTFRYDCSGFVSFVYAHLGYQMITPSAGRLNGVARIYRYAKHVKAFHKRKIPRVGDVIFWDKTYDINRDKKLNDPWTHIAIVESIASDGTVTYIHNTKKNIIRGHLNLFHPDKKRNRYGKVINSRLRRCINKKDKCLSGQLWSGFGTFIKRPLPLHLNQSLSDPLLSWTPTRQTSKQPPS